MEGERLEKKISNWATNLGFRLADGSAPQPDYFSLLTTTPHRRQLWETLIESVHPRKKVETMRKQLLASQKKPSSLKNVDSKQIVNRIGLWKKQCSLETDINQKRNSFIKLENNILERASNLLFEICRLSELEKQYDELKEKTLVLILFKRRGKQIIKEMEKTLLNIVQAPSQDTFTERHSLSSVEDKLKNFNDNSSGECKSSDYSHECDLLDTIKNFCDSGINEEKLWKEVIKCKKLMLEKLSTLLDELNSHEKREFSEKELELEKSLKSSQMHLKQKLTEKSLQVILNETEGQLLLSEINGLLEKLDRLVFNCTEDRSLNSSISFLVPEEINESFAGKDDILIKFRNYVNFIGLNSYHEFLKGELSRLDDELAKKQEQWKDQKEGEKDYQRTLNSIESVCDEISLLKLDQEEQNREIIRAHDELQVLVNKIRNEVNDETYASEIEEIIGKLKSGADKQIDIFVETPMDVFKMIESPSCGQTFECESLEHCLRNYGGEFKQFFSSMLISPHQDVNSILRKVEQRKKLMEETKKFITERNHLSTSQNKILSQLTSMKLDSDLCEKNFKDSEGILWNVLHRADELEKRIEFIKKVLKSWLEQPYRLMVKDLETFDGKTLKEYEEKYKKAGTQ